MSVKGGAHMSFVDTTFYHPQCKYTWYFPSSSISSCKHTHTHTHIALNMHTYICPRHPYLERLQTLWYSIRHKSIHSLSSRNPHNKLLYWKSTHSHWTPLLDNPPSLSSPLAHRLRTVSVLTMRRVKWRGSWRDWGGRWNRGDCSCTLTSGTMTEWVGERVVCCVHSKRW